MCEAGMWFLHPEPLMLFAVTVQTFRVWQFPQIEHTAA